MNDDERLAIVSSVKWVDELIFDTPYTASLPFLDSIDADFCVHGDDISITADGTDAYGEAKAAGRMKIVKRTEGISTTDIVGRLLLLTRSPHTQPAEASSSIGCCISAIADEEPSAAPVDGYVTANVSSTGVSQFLPTTWRLRQFSSGRAPAPGDRVVYVDGAFDILHAGHIGALLAARRKGDFLLVGLHDDATVNQARGQNHPIMSLHERALSLLSMGCVDDVILGAPYKVSSDLICTMNIAVVVLSPDDPKLVVNPGGTNTKAGAPPASPPVADRFAKAKELGVFQESEFSHPLTLDSIVQRIIENRTRYEARNAKREKKELNYMQNQKTFVAEL